MFCVCLLLFRSVGNICNLDFFHAQHNQKTNEEVCMPQTPLNIFKLFFRACIWCRFYFNCYFSWVASHPALGCPHFPHLSLSVSIYSIVCIVAILKIDLFARAFSWYAWWLNSSFFILGSQCLTNQQIKDTLCENQLIFVNIVKLDLSSVCGGKVIRRQQSEA